MKKVFFASMAALFFAVQTVPANAVVVPFTVSATINKVSNVTVSATSVLSANSASRSPVINNQLAMDPMTYNTALGNYLPDHYFVIDTGATGAGLNVVMTYAEGNNPNGTGHGLGWKTTGTFFKVTLSGTTETEAVIATHGDANGKKLLKDLANETFTTAQTNGGWLRAYVGVNFAGDPKQVTGAEMFTNADAAGAYSGTLTVTATAV
ncbi:MAG: hypothetical protein HQL17_03810 [Candidatus Omnitrophica bacterium]|nr:hypothetical protein [Candidatus Omnitrophota bacterium]